jgi:hypothetical protein
MQPLARNILQYFSFLLTHNPVTMANDTVLAEDHKNVWIIFIFFKCSCILDTYIHCRAIPSDTLKLES